MPTLIEKEKTMIWPFMIESTDAFACVRTSITKKESKHQMKKVTTTQRVALQHGSTTS